VVLNKSAATPNAVFSSAVLEKERPRAVVVLKLPSGSRAKTNPLPCSQRCEAKKVFCPSAVLNLIASVWPEQLLCALAAHSSQAQAECCEYGFDFSLFNFLQCLLFWSLL
jgi:hypothetical protein